MSETLKKATRDGFGDEIVALGKENSNILVVDVDIVPVWLLAWPPAVRSPL